jgi:hypothetical protein
MASKLSELLKREKKNSGQLIIPLLEELAYVEQLEIAAEGGGAGYRKSIEEAELAAQFFKEDAERMKASAKKRDDTRRGFELHPSGLSACSRAVWMKHFGAVEEQDIDPTNVYKLTQIFEYGDFFHLRMQIQLTRFKLMTAREEKYRIEKLRLSGRRDGRYDGSNPLLREKVIYEFKSINDRGFQELKKLGAPREAHAAQGQCDLHVNPDHKLVILYENKNQQEKLEFVHEPDTHQYKQVERAGLESIESIEKATLPPRVAVSMYDQPCKYCGLKMLCWNNVAMGSFEEKAKAYAKKVNPLTGEPRVRKVKIGGRRA